MKLLLLCLAPLLALPLDAQCQTQKLVGAQAVPMDFFGKSCDIDGTQAVVGAYSVENSSPGAAYVFEKGPIKWVQRKRLTPSDIGGSNDQFGNSVGISGDLVVVGSEFNTNALGSNAGAAYVYEKVGGIWTEVDKLTAFGQSSSTHFGEYVVIDGDIIVVGNREDGSFGNNSGAAFVFERIAGVWTGVAKLIGSDAARNDLSADSLAIQNGRIVMGSYRSDSSGGKSGSAYVFEKVGGIWTETGRLIANDSAGELSRSIALDGDRILLGARRDGSAASDAGAGYVFELQAGSWVQTAKLVASNAGAGDLLGESCALVGDRLVLSSHFNDRLGSDRGSAIVFELQGGSWTETDILQGGDLSNGNQFSHALAMSGDILLSTAPFHNGSRGSAYTFSFDPVDCNVPQGTVMPYGLGLGGANIGTLSLIGTPNINSPISLILSGIPSGTTGFIWLTPVQVNQSFRGGTLLAKYLNAPAKFPIVLTNGTASVNLALPPGIAGITIYSQAGAFDATQPQGLALTNGLQIFVGG